MLRLLWLAVLLVLSPKLALAEAVPMCGELGQSIEAPPPIYPGREATLGQAHCARDGATNSWQEDASLPPQAEETRTTKSPLGYFVGERLPRVSRTRVPLPRPDDFELPRGVRREIERPPRSAAATLL